MQPAHERPRIGRFGFYIASLILAVVLWRFQLHLNAVAFETPGTIFSSPSTDNSIQWQQMAVQTASDAMTLLTTLATAMLGALGLLIMNRGRNRLKLRHWWSAWLSAAGAGVSLYYGYVNHLYLLAMIKNENFDPYGAAYLVPSHIQFYALLIAFFFLADCAFHDLLEEN